MKRKILLILSLFILCGCQSTPTRVLSEHVTLYFFYTKTCPVCKSFQKNAISYLKEIFGHTITIESYDLDDAANKFVYDSVIYSLEDFDDELYGRNPFYAVDGYFAKLWYTVGDEKYLADDIEHAIHQEPLSDELSDLRYLYQ
ncbi:hypothetical protein [Candidatus Stoquefichus massiliensis]|uniref:hypothetical protein n=1 Tax=Candidatus Stoquefichus massiliensis TaxID=1470350 RepID=UPI0004811128|nr:hypothetical protein [Candidatus Stoquefichus massiliensis]